MLKFLRDIKETRKRKVELMEVYEEFSYLLDLEDYLEDLVS